MPGQKRSLQDSTASRKSKKTKLSEHAIINNTTQEKPSSTFVPEEVDFPRGGGTSFTPLEVKAIRAEAIKEANELFDVSLFIYHSTISFN
jgi:rRNA biogenesis protein RRP5